MAEKMLARLRPYNPRAGLYLQRYTAFGIKFEDGKGWYRVDGRVADYLKKVRSLPEDENSQLAFDVCTEAEAKDMNEREFQAVVQSGRATPEGAHPTAPEVRDVSTGGDLTSADLARGTSRAAAQPARTAAGAPSASAAARSRAGTR